MKKYLLLLCSVYALSQPIYYYNHGKKIIVEEPKERSLHSYFLAGNKKIEIKKSFFVKFKKDIDPLEILSQFDIDDYKKITNRLYQIKTNTEKEAIQLSSKIYETGKVVYSQPNFVLNPQWR